LDAVDDGGSEDFFVVRDSGPTPLWNKCRIPYSLFGPSGLFFGAAENTAGLERQTVILIGFNDPEYMIHKVEQEGWCVRTTPPTDSSEMPRMDGRVYRAITRCTCRLVLVEVNADDFYRHLRISEGIVQRRTGSCVMIAPDRPNSMVPAEDSKLHKLCMTVPMQGINSNATCAYPDVAAARLSVVKLVDENRGQQGMERRARVRSFHERVFKAEDKDIYQGLQLVDRGQAIYLHEIATSVTSRTRDLLHGSPHLQIIQVTEQLVEGSFEFFKWSYLVDSLQELLLSSALVAPPIADGDGGAEGATYISPETAAVRLKALQIPRLPHLEILGLSRNELADLDEAKISAAQYPMLTVLWLQFNNLKTLPESICECQCLEQIDLQANKIKTLPERFWQLKNLSRLNLNRNQLRKLPELNSALPGMPPSIASMVYLNINENQLSAIPAVVFEMINLEEFSARSNSIEVVSSKIELLTRLKVLTLSQNKITSLPTSIGSLKSLEKLRLSSNSLTSLPSTISRLSNLVELDCHGNRMTSIPSDIHECIKLSSLILHSNELVEIPSEIGYLLCLVRIQLQHNAIQDIPPSVGMLENVQQFHIWDNHLITLPGSFGHNFHKTCEVILDDHLMKEASCGEHLQELRIKLNRLLDRPSGKTAKLLKIWRKRAERREATSAKSSRYATEDTNEFSALAAMMLDDANDDHKSIDEILADIGEDSPSSKKKGGGGSSSSIGGGGGSKGGNSGDGGGGKKKKKNKKKK